MSKERKLIPELRFPEFVNDNEWEEKQLGEFLLRNPEYGLNEPAVPYSEFLPTYLRITDISESGNYIFENKVSVDCNVTENDYLSDGDIVLARTGASVGKSYKYRAKDGELVFAGFLIRVKPNPDRLDSELLFQYFSTTTYWDWVKKVSERSGQPGINGTQYFEMPIALPPSKQEQQKIAACLSSLDELIAAHNDKFEALKDHKKGLMQNLFPQEGETVPKMRFPEFEGDGEWVKSSLNQISPSIFDGTHQTPKYTEDGIPFYSVENIVSGSKNKFISVDDYLHETRINKPEMGDVLITRIGSIGIPKVVDWDYEFSIYVTLAVIKKSSIFNSYYLASYIQSNRFQIEILRRSLLNAAPQKINMNELRECEILLPPDNNKLEQQKIASCLSAVDNLITAQQDKIEQLQQHKKGLMQGLFPRIEN